jgi:hypothetical protein
MGGPFCLQGFSQFSGNSNKAGGNTNQLTSGAGVRQYRIRNPYFANLENELYG